VAIGCVLPVIDKLSRRIQNISKTVISQAISRKNILSWIPQIGVQGLTMLYLISCYNGPQYNGAYFGETGEIIDSLLLCLSANNMCPVSTTIFRTL